MEDYNACNILCSPILSLSDIDKVDRLIHQVFIAAENLYGSGFLTLNTHLHLHLKQCFYDYGPCYSFWFFSFEHYNGILGKFHTNHTSVEVQLMRFTDNQCFRNLACIPSELGSTSTGTSTDTLFGQATNLSSTRLISITQCTLQPSMDYVECCPQVVKLLLPFVLQKLDSVSLVHLRNCYQTFLPT